MMIDLSRLITADAKAEAALADAKARSLTSLIGWIDAVTAEITGPMPGDEKLSWTAKEAAARAVVEERATKEQAALIADEAAVFGETEAELCRKIIENADTWRGIIAVLTAIRRRAVATIRAARTPQEADAVLDKARAEWAALPGTS